MDLVDTALFRHQAYVDSAWVAVGSGVTPDETNPSTGAPRHCIGAGVQSSLMNQGARQL
jgi:hypothetical protein